MILVALILIFPESPRWLIDHGHKEDGLRTLARLHAHGDVDDAWVKAEFAQIEEAISFDHDHEAKSYMELFRNRYVNFTQGGGSSDRKWLDVLTRPAAPPSDVC